MTTTEKLIVTMLVRIFWLITQTPGVARYASDVRFFGEAEKLTTDSPERIAYIENLIKGYEKDVRI